MSKHVFHIVTHFDMGGAEKIALEIAGAQSGGYIYHIIEVARGEGKFSKCFVEEMQRRNIHYHRSFVWNKKLGIILFPFWFLWDVLKYRPVIIHSHTEIPDLAIYIFAFLFGHFFSRIHFVRTIHNTMLWDKWDKIGGVVENFFISQHSNIAIGEAVSQAYSKKYGDVPIVISNGVGERDQKKFSLIDPHKTNILFAGRLEYQKGVDQLLQVMKAFKDDPLLEFWIVGNGSISKEVNKVVGEMCNAHYLEKVFGLSAYLASFDYLFMPSNYEGLGLMSIEASLAKLPTIINSCPGLKDTLPSEWPLKVVDNNVNQYINIFCHIKDYDRNGLGELAYKYVKSHFSIDLMQNKYEDFYSQIVRK